MGWVILASPRGDYDDCYVAFACNTGDEAFGPLTSARGTPAHVKNQFYDHWEEACREVIGHPIDPRTLNSRGDYSLLYQIAYLTVVLGGIETYQTREEYDEMFNGGEDE